MPKKTEEVITFKVDREMLARLRSLPNRSQFIREAVSRALEETCPLCGGVGYLSSKQREHWEAFSRNHRIATCPDCHEVHVVCESEDG